MTNSPKGPSRAEETTPAESTETRLTNATSGSEALRGTDTSCASTPGTAGTTSERAFDAQRAGSGGYPGKQWVTTKAAGAGFEGETVADQTSVNASEGPSWTA